MQRKETGIGPRFSRRHVLASAGAAAAMASVPDWTAAQAEIDRLKAEGWEAHPCACNMCGGYCGLLALHKKGEAPSPQTVRIMPNPTHPQRGMCARGASAMWVWNHPLRFKKPLKRIGERGEGKFKEVSWDEALDDIAKKVREIVEKHGEHAISMTSHNFSGMQKWFSSALGTPNAIGHQSTCNSASIMGRRMVFGAGFDGAGKVEPDYENCTYLLCVGRTLNCAIGIAAVAGKSREKGGRVVFVDPRMPEGAFAGSEWVPIRPGTDSAFLLALIGVGITENLIDREFLARWTNAPYLVDAATLQPVTADAIGEAKDHWLVFDEASAKLVLVGLVKDEKGAVKGYDEPENLKPVLDYSGTIEINGTTVTVKSCFALLKDVAAKYQPAAASKITGIPADTIVRIAREFFTHKGACDDGWYSSRNGNDSEAYQLMSMINLFTGRLDQVGGFVVTQGGGLKMPSAGNKGTKGTGPQGQTWQLADGKALDKVYYPEGGGTYSAIFDAILTGKPYPIRAAFITGTTMFHREANCPRMVEAFKALDLLVFQDIFPQQVIDFADYVLPCTYFLEWREYAGVKWARDGYVQFNNAGLNPPPGNDSREEIWQFCEILRRAFPERAAERLGYDRELKTREEYHAWMNGMVDKAWAKFLAGKEKAKEGDAERIQKAIDKNGWALSSKKKYGVYPYVKPFGTPTGKPEIFSFMCAAKYAQKGFTGLVDYEAPKGYTAPKPRSDEFYLVSGKDNISASGPTIYTWPQKFLGDRRVWMNPTDAERLGVKDGDAVELESLDTHFKDRTKVRVTNRVMPGSLFALSFQGGVRTKNLPKEYAWTREGINSNWFCTGYREPVVGALANNCSVRVKRV